MLSLVTDNCLSWNSRMGENDWRKDFMIYPHDSYVAELGFKLATPGSARHAFYKTKKTYVPPLCPSPSHNKKISLRLPLLQCKQESWTVEVLRPSQPMKVTLHQSVYLTSLFLGRLSPLSVSPVLMHSLLLETDNCPSWISRRERMTGENISWSISTKECCRTW